ncbi:hypothetical protein DW702_09685 [Bacteroides salyersiae]|nr:hypothetical protein DW702_09685 [Bacteroides salyersiae]RYT42739.1 hypothetical protein EAJ08_21675 [Bacteroides salyersiae]
MSKKFTLKARNITDRKNRALNPDVINKKQYQHSQNKTFLFKHKKTTKKKTIRQKSAKEQIKNSFFILYRNIS